MKHLIYYTALLAFLLTSCEKQISIVELHDESKILLYAMPTDSDEFVINISSTIPASGVITNPDILKVECWTNGIPDEVTFVEKISVEEPYVYVYKAHGHHKSGDEIRIAVTDARLKSVKATTTIPEATDCTITDAGIVEWNGNRKLRFHLNFTDHSTQDYYATRVLWVGKNGTKYGMSISIEFEPIFDRIVDSGLDTWHEYYESIYPFTDKKMMNPKVSMYMVSDMYFPNYEETESFDLEFFTLSRDYYLMLRQLNDQRSNELGESGFSPMVSTYTNVEGGYGCVAGYICSKKRILSL